MYTLNGIPYTDRHTCIYKWKKKGGGGERDVKKEDKYWRIIFKQDLLSIK